MSKFKQFITTLLEAFDSSVDYQKDDWGYQDEETGELTTHINETATFTVGEIDYIWVAKKNFHDENVFEITFGVDKKKKGFRGIKLIDVDMTGTGNARTVLSTVIDITNDFLATFENIRMITFTSKEEEESRTKLYSKLVEGGYIDDFEFSDKQSIHGEMNFTLERVR